MNGNKLALTLISYSNQYNATNAATKSIDGATNTYWRFATSPANIVVRATGKLCINGLRYYGSTSSYRGKSIKISVSADNVDYTEIFSDSALPTTATWKEYEIDNATYIQDPYIKVEVTGNNASRCYVYELELYGTEYVAQIKYLIQSNGNLYKADGTMVNAPFNASTFNAYGSSSVPTAEQLSSFVNPKLLLWAEDEEHPFKVVQQAIPYPQTIYSENYNMTDKSILGIEKAIVEATEDVLFAISFDDGASWKIYTEQGQWGTLSEEDTGMTSTTLNSISSESWNSVATTGQFKVRATLSNKTSSITSFVIDYIN